MCHEISNNGHNRNQKDLLGNQMALVIFVKRSQETFDYSFDWSSTNSEISELSPSETHEAPSFTKLTVH